MLGAATTLRRTDLEAHTNELLDGMASRARKMDRLLSDVLDLERLGHGIVEPSTDAVDVGRLVGTLVRETDHAGSGDRRRRRVGRVPAERRRSSAWSNS